MSSETGWLSPNFRLLQPETRLTSGCFSLKKSHKFK
jgi:hypothetical protein